MRKFVAAGALALAASGAFATPPGDWTMVPSPNSHYTRTGNYLTATACVAANDCWAVGYYNATVSTYQTLIEHWDGAAWSVVPSPNTGAAQSNVLRGVSCRSATDCWAVGSWNSLGSPQRTLILHWDGSAWSLTASPSTGESDYDYLLGVACAFTGECWAAGYRNAGGGFQTLIERWDGAAWTIVNSPNAGGTQSFLEGIACASSTCWAVGWSVNATTGFNQTLVEQWSGGAWSIVSSPNPVLTTHNDLHGVTCVAASECWAVGSSNNGNVQQTLVQRWNGSAWSAVTSPSSAITEANSLRGVSCASSSECWAVGTYTTGGAARTLALRWNGSAWAVAATPNGSATDNTAFAVACAAGGCTAAGFFDDAGMPQTLALHTSGAAWLRAASANNLAPQNNTLIGVECATAADCWAVASYYNGSVQQSLIEHWDGAAWSIVASPNTSATESNILYDVSCTSAADCWTVGYALGATGWHTLALHWDGQAWEIVASPSALGGDNFLTDVACPAAADCWAVGFYNNGSNYQTLVEHWDGAEWSLVTSGNTDVAAENRLSGVSCRTASDCWAVGLHKIDGFLQQTLVEHWDGAEWTIVNSPNTPSPQANVLEDVSCESASACWAVGSYSPAGGSTAQPLVLRWDGSAWTIASSPQPSANASNYLRGVHCVAAGDCWAVGDFFSGDHSRTLTEHWDGSAWRVVGSPNSSATQANRLVGVRCPSAAECLGVGYFTDDAGIFHTLTQRYVAAVSEPAHFSFIDRAGVATNVYVTSETRTLGGFTGPLPVAIDGGQYRLNGGAWVSAAGQALSGDSISVRHVSAASSGTAKTSTLTVGGWSTGFTSVTSSLDRTPDAFDFGTRTGVAPGASVESEARVAQGYNAGSSIVPGAGIAYRIDGGAWTTASGTLQPGQSLQVRHVASGSSLGYTKTYLKVGGVTAVFTTRTQ